jgi:hypothetical protein
MKYSLMLAIFVYVIVYSILYSNTHLVPYHANGFGNLEIQHPVMNCRPLDKGCLANFHNIAKLPYCKQYLGGEEKAMELDRRLDPEQHPNHLPDDLVKKEVPVFFEQKVCRYLDNRRLEWEAGIPSETFIPTLYKQVRQKINPDCYDPVKHTQAELETNSKFRCKTPWVTDETFEYYVADIENFDLKLTHSFTAAAISAHGVSTDFQGVFAACKDNHPLDVMSECKRAKVPNSQGAMAPEDEVGLVTAEEMGVPSLHSNDDNEDVIKFEDLLKVTPVAQRYNITENVLDALLPGLFGHDGGTTLREHGAMLLLDVDYSNVGMMRPGIPGLPPIKPTTYTYRPYFIPTNQNTRFEMVEQLDYPDKRVVDIWYGVTIKMQFNGEIVAFTWAKLLSGLTSGLVLLTMATTLVTYAALYVMPSSEKYNWCMFQMSEDFSNFKSLRARLMMDAKWDTRTSGFATGKKIEDHLKDDGTMANKLSNKELLQILSMIEVRCNRMDGIDTRMVYDDMAEAQKTNVGKLVKEFEDQYYKDLGCTPARTPAE